MKRIGLLWAGFGVWLLAAVSAPAAPKSDAGTRESLFASARLAPLSIGGDVESFTRKMVWKAGGDAVELSGDRRSGMVGVDPVRWLTLFGTFGQLEGALDGSDSASNRPVWSLGAGLNFWHTDLTRPEFLSGRLSLRGGAEITGAEFDDARFGGGEWSERAFLGTLNYEIFVDRRESLERVPYSLLLYAGWAHSRLDGEVGAGANRREFENDRKAWVTYGADLFVSSNLSLGIHLQHWESANWRASARYRF